MYTLYYLPGACSRAIHALLIELGADVQLVHRNPSPDFARLNPTGQVPVLVDNDLVLREGAAIVLYLLEKHAHAMLPCPGADRARFTQQLMFANATLHPAYGRLFFISQHIDHEPTRLAALEQAARMISDLWQTVDRTLATSPFVCGAQPTVVDMMLTVYASWGELFPVDIPVGENVQRLLTDLAQHPSFVKAVEQEQAHQAA
ncbi:glutathione S-transferase family protein [Marinobacter sp. M1N3S26]|uniref:glutathione S-transferase family protein n=1 Tax=unclassified Marinobacter TaxID=83889 RepID=UPI00387B2CA2